jgi:hypothetical protein
MIFVLICYFSESLLNIKEDFRSKPTSWYAVGWMPIILYGDGKARQTRHSIGAFLGDQQVLHILNIPHIHDF